MSRNITAIFILAASLRLAAQPILRVVTSGSNIDSVWLSGRLLQLPDNRLPIATWLENGRAPAGRIILESGEASRFRESLRLNVKFTNISRDTVRLSNVVPMGEDPRHVYITGKGDHPLSRTHLFVPGRTPVNIIVPDNAWELGYRDVRLYDEDQQPQSLYVLARRDVSSISRGARKRFETILYPGGSVAYFIWIDTYSGSWQNGLSKCFRNNHLYDLEQFDDSMYQRQDQHWIRKAYVMHLLMGWDKSFYDYTTGRFGLTDFVRKGKQLYGGDDVICIWPTWPSLGLDQRNQFDLYRDLPGGLPALRAQADSLRMLGTRFFIAYNPWDESTRKEDHLAGLEKLLRETGADGVVLDTRGSSSRELQMAADRVRPGIVMYSEGMAIPKDMPGIVSGRVHNALYYPPMLNLNKLIKPDFAIFRVAEVFKEPIRREYATAFFNGYGTEINQFAPGHPEWEPEQYRFLGKTSRILRENSSNFLSSSWTPLIRTLHDSIWVNFFPGTAGKDIYTIFHNRPEGYSGPLLNIPDASGRHVVDLWRHEELTLSSTGTVSVTLDGFPARDLGTNNEGNTGCVGVFPKVLDVVFADGILSWKSSGASVVRIWAGEPSYDKQSLQVGTSGILELHKAFSAFEGKIIIQAFDAQEELLDERVITIVPGTPIRIQRPEKTLIYSAPPRGMIRVPAGTFNWKTTHGDEFIRYPQDPVSPVAVGPLAVDKFPVTNRQFAEFMRASGYRPADTARFLKHWSNGSPVRGEEDLPVVYVTIEDAHAFARWAGKRLPSEAEWQWAAQTPAGMEWPWKQKNPVTRKKEYVNETLTVTRLEGIEAGRCDPGNGVLKPVGSYPRGANPYGLQDLVGSVWQLTSDVYESGSYRYVIMKGGSYWLPSASWWYVQAGPRELHYRQYLLRVSPGFERNATVGFRCVADLAR